MPQTVRDWAVGGVTAYVAAPAGDPRAAATTSRRRRADPAARDTGAWPRLETARPRLRRQRATDESRPVRDEDAVDVGGRGRLAARARGDDRDVPDGEPEVRQFPGGASNLTYLLRWPGRELILRRPPAGAKARGAHDMGREFVIQRALGPVYPYVAGMVGLCRDESVARLGLLRHGASRTA